LRRFALAFVLIATLRSNGPAAQQAGDQAAAPSDAEQRANSLLGQMTLDEKIGLVHGDGFRRDSGYAGHLPGIERLGIPDLYVADGPNGVGNGSTGVTVFPSGMAVSSTWDPQLVEAFGAALGREQAGKGHNVALAPTVNIVRVPQWGRAFESLSEDPWLAGRIAIAVIKGIQSQGVIATVKHYAANNQETRRNSIDVKVSERALREIYLPAFQAAVVEGGVGAVMCSYNRLGGTFACEHPWLLTDLLKREWGFGGFVMSDWFATRSTETAATAGLDMEMPGGPSSFAPEYFGTELKKAVESRRVTVAVLDEKVRRILISMGRAGLLDRKPTAPEPRVSTDDTRRAARDVAAQGTVLLRNERNALPLDSRTIRSLAVIGDAASDHPKLSGGGSAQVAASRTISPLDGIRARAGAAVRITYARGTRGSRPLPALTGPALTPAAGEGSGFTATYFPSPDFSGAPAATRVEPQIGNPAQAPGPGAGPPVAGLPRVWSARFAASLKPTTTGTYRFTLSGAGSARLLIDGRRVVSLRADFPTVEYGTADLEIGKTAEITVEFAATGLFGGIEVGWQPPEPKLLQDAVAAAKSSDAAVIVVDDVTTEGADRSGLAVPGDQDALIAAVAAANPRTIVVLNTGGPVLMPWANKVAAVLEAWYPGQESGDAIAAVLYGDVNPCGRLPVTFPADSQRAPATSAAAFPGDGTTVTYDEGLLVGYRWFDAKNERPLYPFGHGLSYTTFKYDSLQASTAGSGQARVVTVHTHVTNTGRRKGAEIVQLYVAFPPEAGEPPRQLKGFQKVTLDPGASQDVAFTLDARALSIWSEEKKDWVVLPGAYGIAVGSSSRDVRLQTRVGW
jgi:beta-glucosidase